MERSVMGVGLPGFRRTPSGDGLSRQRLGARPLGPPSPGLAAGQQPIDKAARDAGCREDLLLVPDEWVTAGSVQREVRAVGGQQGRGGAETRIEQERAQ